MKGVVFYTNRSVRQHTVIFFVCREISKIEWGIECAIECRMCCLFKAKVILKRR